MLTEDINAQVRIIGIKTTPKQTLTFHVKTTFKKFPEIHIHKDFQTKAKNPEAKLLQKTNKTFGTSNSSILNMCVQKFPRTCVFFPPFEPDN